MKVVLDSIIIIAAFTSRGLCNSLFELCIEKYEIIISTFILNEVTRNLSKKFKLPKNKVDAISNYLKEYATIKKYKTMAKPICRDIDDDEIISLALEHSIKTVITGDKDLLVLKKYQTIQFVTPREFWELLKERVI